MSLLSSKEEEQILKSVELIISYYLSMIPRHRKQK